MAANGPEVLEFQHPLAGKQLLKESVKENETEMSAAKRELFEESGLRLKHEFVLLARSTEIVPDQEWTLFLGTANDLPDRWTHFYDDDGGHLFEFFWQPLDQPLSDKWHCSYRKTVDLVRLRRDEFE